MKKIKILYIEDDADQRKELSGRLRGKGYQVSSAASGKTGVVQFQKQDFDAVLCDLNMPEMDGLEVLDKIRNIDPDIPFILISSHGTGPIAVKAVKKGADHLVLKSSEINQIALTIEQAIEKSRLHKELQASQNALRRVSENVPDIVYSLNPEGEFISLSPSVEPGMGYKPSELLGDSVFKIIHPDDRQRVKAAFMRSTKIQDAEKDKIVQFRMLTKGGQAKHFEIRRKLVLEEGRLIRSDGIARDITHRVNLEEKLRNYHEDMAETNLNLLEVQQKLEEKNTEMEKLLEELSRNKDELQTIINTNPSGIIMVDKNGIIKTSNRAVTDYFGLTQKEVISTPFDEFIEKIKDNFEDIDKFREGIKQCQISPVTAGKIDIHDLFSRGVRVNKHKPGILAPTCCPVQDENHRKIGWLWIFSEISFLKQADAQVHAIVDSSPIPTIISRLADGKILYANEKLATLVGMTVQELIGQNSPDFYYDPDDRKIVVESLRRDGYLRDFEVRIKKVDGTVVWMIFSLVISEMEGEKVILGWLYDISGRKKNEEDLARERNFISAILNTAGALVVVQDTKGRIVRFNRACEEITGYTFDEVKGKSMWDLFIIPEELQLVKGIFNDLKSGNFPNRGENHWLTKAGESRLIAWSNSVLTNQNDEVEHIIGSGIDITEHRQAEKDIKTRLRYEEGLHACSQALVKEAESKDALNQALGHLLKASDTCRVYIFENFEDPKDGLCLKLTHEVCAPGIPDNLDDPVFQHGVYRRGFKRWQKALSQNQPIMGAIKTFPESERAILEPQSIISILVLPLWVEGKWYGFIGFDDVEICRDWNQDDIRLLRTAAEMIGSYFERKKGEIALKESEARFRSYVEKANDIIYALTPEGIFSYVSPNWTEILGHDVSEIVGKSFAPFVHPDDLQACMEFFEAVMTKGEKQSGIEYRVRHKDGRWRWHTTNASPLENTEGKVLSYIGIAHDITDMKTVMEDLEKSNQELKTTQAQLVQSEKMAALGTLVAGIAHEINTPIGAVSSMHDTLFRTMNKLKNLIEPECGINIAQLPQMQAVFKIIDDSNKVIRSGTERVVNIVRRLKSFARLDEAELKTVDIHEGLEDALALAHHELKHNITIIKNYGDIPPIACYPSQLNQIFLNLLINSKQAIKDKGTIHITTFTKDDKIHIEFKDNGSGISKENLKKIFDPGFTTKGRGVGAGLGLSISYQIIQDHKGRIKVASEPGKGSTFTIILPTDLYETLEKEKLPK